MKATTFNKQSETPLKNTIVIGLSIKLIFLSLLITSCQQLDGQSKSKSDNSSPNESIQLSKKITPAQTIENTIDKRISVPRNYQRPNAPKDSYAHYLRTLKLKPEGSLVRYYDGTSKANHDIYHSVVDLDIGNKDLHQCADAIMRLRAEYLWNQKEYDQIHFNFTNGFRVDYSEWMKGRRIEIKGNKTKWNNRNEPSNDYKDFWDYLETIFMYAGTASLSKELKKVDLSEAKTGDILIRGGHPGHAVIIVDEAVNQQGEKIYLLAQSYMPAQEIQILNNNNDPSISPWYHLNQETIQTPEWTFSSNQLKRFDQ